MREEQLTLSGKELKRAQVLTRVLAGEWTECEAAAMRRDGALRRRWLGI